MWWSVLVPSSWKGRKECRSHIFQWPRFRELWSWAFEMCRKSGFRAKGAFWHGMIHDGVFAYEVNVWFRLSFWLHFHFSGKLTYHTWFLSAKSFAFLTVPLKSFDGGQFLGNLWVSLKFILVSCGYFLVPHNYRSRSSISWLLIGNNWILQSEVPPNSLCCDLVFDSGIRFLIAYVNLLSVNVVLYFPLSLSICFQHMWCFTFCVLVCSWQDHLWNWDHLLKVWKFLCSKLNYHG